MGAQSEIFGFQLTPEVAERLTRLINDLLGTLEKQTNTPEEALIVLDGAKRTLEAKHGIVLMFPGDHEHIGRS